MAGFDTVIRGLKEDPARRYARKGWNGKGIYISMQVPDEGSKMTLPYIYMVTTGLVSEDPHAVRGIVPWLASQTDMLADDWEEVGGMDVKQAFRRMSDGASVRRRAWRYRRCKGDRYAVYSLSVEDVLANDWEEVDG